MRPLTVITTLIGVVFFGWAVTRLFNIDPEPIVVNVARLVGGGKLVEFNEVFVGGLDTDLRVCSVDRVDTDGDGFREWLVFYQYDTVAPTNWRQPCPDKTSRLGAIYDNDRGTPPGIVFPYALKPPTRDLLGEEGTTYALAEIVDNPVEAGTSNRGALPELLVYGQRDGVNNQLTIFKFQQNTDPWDLPRDDPPRYRVLGDFEGNGGVLFDLQTKQVTTLDRGPYERSQLAIRNVYALRGDPGQETYMSMLDPTQLAAPIRSTIDFAFGPPDDILYSEFPEKIVLAFFQSLDQSRTDEIESDSQDFLAPAGAAIENYDPNNLGYFFGRAAGDQVNASDVNNLAITKLQYYPDVEENTLDQAERGARLQQGRVDVDMVGERLPFVSASYKVIFQEGRWWISGRLQ